MLLVSRFFWYFVVGFGPRREKHVCWFQLCCLCLLFVFDTCTFAVFMIVFTVCDHCRDTFDKIGQKLISLDQKVPRGHRQDFIPTIRLNQVPGELLPGIVSE